MKSSARVSSGSDVTVRAPPAAKPLDAIDAKPASPDGKAFVTAALKDIAARTARGEKVRVVFDIDDTLADTRARTLAIAKAWDAANGTSYFGRLTLAQVAHTGLDTARALNLPWPAEKAFVDHWSVAFWDGASFAHDLPIPETIALAKAAKAAGAELVYLTGRWDDREHHTIDQLRRFGLEAGPDNVVSKPGPSTLTVPFKAGWLEQSRLDGFHCAFFITESRRDIAGIQAAGEPAVSVLLDHPFGGPENVRPETPVYPRAI
ncbi:MAG: hypothetical protein JNK82_06030 [Myxococcaceae bacterium]|nr:hypothetical protein [Myxococcaceae bacterium]